MFQKLNGKTDLVVKRGNWRAFQEPNHARALWAMVRVWILILGKPVKGFKQESNMS